MARPRDSQPLAVHTLGDAAVAIPIDGVAGSVETTASVRAVAEAIEQAQLPGVVDVVPSPDRVTLCCAPAAMSTLDAMLDRLTAILRDAAEPSLAGPGQLHEIPVHYGGHAGPDLEEVCRVSGLEPKQVIARHTSADYLVTAVGFTPGFAYLGGLHPSLAVPRRATPRTHVPAGSVGIGGAQTGVYPSTSPGGWQIIGHTRQRFFDPLAARPALCSVGDRVRFAACGPEGFSAETSAACEQPPPHIVGITTGTPRVTVVEPGLMTSVQDLGRPGYRACGVTSGGACDPIAAALANHLVGNPPNAALLELTLTGPTLHFPQRTRVALTGGTFPGIAGRRPVTVAAGSTLAIGHASRGCRGYLAIAGGIDLPEVLGSRSTDLSAGFGGLAGRPLLAGDVLPIGESLLPAPDTNWGISRDLFPLPESPARLRLIVPDGATLPVTGFLGTPYQVTSRSNRMGLRLAGPPLVIPEKADGISRAVVPGTVQLPPDGQPILLLADCQTIGGYPVIGHVASADLHLAAQLRPGDMVTFEHTTRADAVASWQKLQSMLTSTAERIAERWPVHLPSLATTNQPLPDRSAAALRIDLNCDVGEGAALDDVLIPLVSSVNIACGGHAGDAATMAAAARLAAVHGVAIGAHPGHPDREYFGRRQLAITPAEATTLVCEQIAHLITVTGQIPAHVKLHGGLYHQVAYDADLADAVCRGLAATWPGIRIVLPAGALAITIATTRGLKVVREGFLDRGYRDDGRLADRSTPGGMLVDPTEVSQRAVAFVRENRVTTQSGRDLAIVADTLCLHGDGPAAASLLKAVRAAFAVAGIQIGPHSAPTAPRRPSR